VQSTGLSPYDPRPNTPINPLTPCFNGSQVQFSSFFNSEFKFLLINESNFHVIGFSYGPTTRDAMGRVSRSRAASDMAAAATSRWILVPPSGGYWLPPSRAGYPGQSSSTPPPPSSHGYWPPPPWAPPAGGQAPP
jgi:hypothetical protein